MDSEYFAHSPGNSPELGWHDLGVHLRSVAELAERFGAAFGCPRAALQAGLWHDAGKYSPAFQRYLRESHQWSQAKDAAVRIRPRPRSPVHHAPVGALAWRDCAPLACVIAAHHAGLVSREDMRQRLTDEWPANGHYLDAIKLAGAQLGAPEIDPALAEELKAKTGSALDCELLIRLLFSALVDADRLDTERFANPEQAALRSRYPDLRALLPPYAEFMAALAKGSADSAVRASEVNRVREAVLADCIAASAQLPGVHRLTVPTGGGKTLASLGFALHHAKQHGLRRIVMAIPYTSIIDQTAAVYREVFKSLGDVVVEHHSALGENSWPGGAADGASQESEQQVRHEFACENWDAPLIVTTNVQLFDSLFSNHTSACRKLHNLARSVIILDEAQTLPPEMLRPCVSMLEGLVRVAGCSIVLCTATQPALDANTYYFKGFKADIVRGDIVPQPERHFECLRRVDYDIRRREDTWDWDKVAREVLSSPQCLCILNTKKDALAVLDALQALAEADALDAGDWAKMLGVFHLSTLLCGAHRKEVLAEVKERLKDGKPCRVVSTQVVEAGVDVDFPLVLRAIGPLDSIVQAAGRCNREGRLQDEHGKARLGRVVVFHPEKGGLPPGSYEVGRDNALSLLAGGDWDINLPETHREYFLRFTQSVDPDKKGIQECRKHLDYPEVAKRGHLIEEGHTEGLIVSWGDKAKSLIGELRRKAALGLSLSRNDYRAANEHTVSVFKNQLKGLDSVIDRKSLDGLAFWDGRYDELRGIVLAAQMDPDFNIV